MSTNSPTPGGGNVGLRVLPASPTRSESVCAGESAHDPCQDRPREFLQAALRTPSNGSPSPSSRPSAGLGVDNRSAQRMNSRMRPRRRGLGRGPHASAVGWTPRVPQTAQSGHSSEGTPPSNMATFPSPPQMQPAWTPAWLRSAYGGAAAAAEPAVAEDPIAAWCAARINALKATAAGGTQAVPELAQVMETLDQGSVEQELAQARKAAQERMSSQARVLEAEREVAEAERRMEKLNRRSARVTMKIERMRAHARFIENGWVDDETAVNGPVDENTAPVHEEENEPAKVNEE